MSATSSISPGLRIALIALAAAAVLVALWLLVAQPLLMVDDVADETAGATDDDAGATQPPPATEQPETVEPAVTYEVFLARDPFEPVREPPASPQPSPPANGDDPSGDAPPPPERGCEQRGEVVCNGRVVSLLDVVQRDGDALIIVQVGDVVHEVRRGETFANNFVALQIEEGCVRFLHSDEQFRLCVGGQVQK